MTEREELLELRRIGDLMQSSLSRVLDDKNGTRPTYETKMARLEGAEAIQEWTAARRKSLRTFSYLLGDY